MGGLYEKMGGYLSFSHGVSIQARGLSLFLHDNKLDIE